MTAFRVIVEETQDAGITAEHQHSVNVGAIALVKRRERAPVLQPEASAASWTRVRLFRAYVVVFSEESSVHRIW